MQFYFNMPRRGRRISRQDGTDSQASLPWDGGAGVRQHVNCSSNMFTLFFFWVRENCSSRPHLPPDSTSTRNLHRGNELFLCARIPSPCITPRPPYVPLVSPYIPPISSCIVRVYFQIVPPSPRPFRDMLAFTPSLIPPHTHTTRTPFVIFDLSHHSKHIFIKFVVYI